MQGFLEFDSLDTISTILEELPDSYASKGEALQHGLELLFCYANPIPVMPVVRGGGGVDGLHARL
jgi:hypothetical protein